MAKYKVVIKRVEYYSLGVVVEAGSEKEAEEKVNAAWEEDNYLYEKCTDTFDDVQMDITCSGIATETDINAFKQID